MLMMKNFASQPNINCKIITAVIIAIAFPEHNFRFSFNNILSQVHKFEL